MTVTVNELIDSRPMSSVGGRFTAPRMFSVYRDSPALSSPDEVVLLFGSNGLPQKGDLFPGTTLEAVDYQIRRYEGQTDLFYVEWTYRDASFNGVGTDKQPGETGYLEVSTEVSASFVPMWRQLTRTQFLELVAPTGLYPYGNQSSFDIDGNPVDVAGEPTSVLRRKVTLVVGVTTNQKPNLAVASQFIGRRNNSIFGGAPQGMVLYTGNSAKRMDAAKWSIEHRFELDEYYHLVQTAYRNPDGRPKLDEDGHAANVTFVQPHPDYGNFYAIDPNFAGQV